MNARSLGFSLLVSLALGGCSDDDRGPSSSTDSGLASDTASVTDTTAPADSNGATETGRPDAALDAPTGPTCAAYCDTVMTNCTGGKNTQYLDRPRCLAMCANLDVGTAADTSGDTLGCRLHHANLAKSEGPEAHCPHAGATGGGVCGANRCGAMCKLAAAHCTGKGAPFADEAACRTACAAMTFDSSAAGGELDQKQRTLNCVQYHLQAAYESAGTHATLHCPHLTIADGPCGP